MCTYIYAYVHITHQSEPSTCACFASCLELQGRTPLSCLVRGRWWWHVRFSSYSFIYLGTYLHYLLIYSPRCESTSSTLLA
ncbi:uncharacterized protein BDW47DRAFT_97343 [Aspergillus candidus]|uniref:Uncharacterized protein n=1 Tax=Aspergillus candidus TaxID=41067 RepID=A0A2I2FPG8_ASPCN|nr:hypothetical protein BDW47DRAFT_97343 [Aspergillus candidus]PLB42524.1 hypothetical protein BDW47DRAFT_97343 [Aspergillus candidus]